MQNNLRYSLSNLKDIKFEEKLKFLEEIIKSKEDTYNIIRAIILKSKLLIEKNKYELITQTDLNLILFSYSHLYYQRLLNLFNKCTHVIWEYFSFKENHDILLNLFKHSSFIWRINGAFDLEKEYLNIMKNLDFSRTETSKNINTLENLNYYKNRLEELENNK